MPSLLISLEMQEPYHNNFVGDESAVSYQSNEVIIVTWLFDKRDYNKFLGNDGLAYMQAAHPKIVEKESKESTQRNKRTPEKRDIGKSTEEARIANEA